MTDDNEDVEFPYAEVLRSTTSNTIGGLNYSIDSLIKAHAFSEDDTDENFEYHQKPIIKLHVTNPRLNHKLFYPQNCNNLTQKCTPGLLRH